MSDMGNLTISNNLLESKPLVSEKIEIDFLISDVLIIKAESLKDRKIFKYAEYLEKQLMKLKNREAVLDLGVPLK
ncbi:TPA_asm: hypothetical protein CBHJFHIM_00016 [Methanobrevibacter gottschalkii virus vir075]|uniref:Uncharacterized protein n=1 Tax=Methanobrevibacter gottschalkii TaxID=190974 RepID=A0A1H7IAM2_9EURY|nr:hypothetical protein [Methanobrevibacter gottschalkii]SEK57655.1 hypothetical protein SAMN05216439_1150 [Methanobrevibacter gottschalkii]